MKLNHYVKPLTFLLLSLGVSASALAAPYAAVDKKSCSRMQNSKQPFILVLNQGDDLKESINQCARAAKLPAASLSGLGQVHNPVLAYFTGNPNDKPTLTTFPGFYELASLNGNITNNAGRHYTHIHVALGDKNFRGIAGHVESAKVGLTVEITIAPLAGSVERTVDAKTGFGQIVAK